MYKVKEIADMAGVSVRTLHHYDRIGLLNPREIRENGYRYYSEENVIELQQILFLKELDFSLDTIKEMMSDSRFRGVGALTKQRKLLKIKRDRLDRIIRTLDETIDSRKVGRAMDKQNMFRAFDMKEIEEHQARYADEIKEKWGQTEAYRESGHKTSQYSAGDWAEIKGEADDIFQSLAAAMKLSPSDIVVQKLVGQWQNHISGRYYKCSREMLAQLGESYVDDERFTRNIDKYGAGLAEFFRDAIRVYCSQI